MNSSGFEPQKRSVQEVPILIDRLGGDELLHIEPRGDMRSGLPAHLVRDRRWVQADAEAPAELAEFQRGLTYTIVPVVQIELIAPDGRVDRVPLEQERPRLQRRSLREFTVHAGNDAPALPLPDLIVQRPQAVRGRLTERL